MAVLEDPGFSEGAGMPDEGRPRRIGARRSIAWMIADIATVAPREWLERATDAVRRWWRR